MPSLAQSGGVSFHIRSIIATHQLMRCRPALPSQIQEEKIEMFAEGLVKHVLVTAKKSLSSVTIIPIDLFRRLNN